MNERKKRTRSVMGRGLFIILFTLMLTSTASAWYYVVGDFVWYDVNGDGKQDPGEQGVDGVIVNAYIGGNLVGSATTGIAHTYCEHGPGTYSIYLGGEGEMPIEPIYLEFILPDELKEDFAFTVPDQGVDDALDSDAHSDGKTSTFIWPRATTYTICNIDAGIVEKQVPCGQCKGGVTILTLRYLGPSDTDGVSIKVYEGKSTKSSKLLYEASGIATGEKFTFSGIRSDFKMGSEISIWVDGVLNTKIHTSCSQPIGPGLIRGDFEVIEGYSKDGGILCPVPDCGKCKGKVTRLKLRYEGSSTADIMVIQKKGITVVESVEPDDAFTIAGLDKNGTLGTKISIHVGDDPVPTEIHTSCSQPIGPGMRFGPFLIVEGYSLKGGRLCPDELLQDCGCEGKVTWLTLQYNGTLSGQTIKVTQKKGEAVFNETVGPGQTFTFAGTDKNGTLGTEISVYVNNALNTKIHTSCSQPIGPGLIFGDFEIIEGYSLKGGPLCPLGENN